MTNTDNTRSTAAETPRPSTETPPHLRGPIIQAYADTNGVAPAELAETPPVDHDFRKLSEKIKSLAAQGPLVERRAEEIRELVFNAQAIVGLASAAAIGDVKPQNWDMQRALDAAWDMLEDAASQLCPGAITAREDDAEAEVQS